MTLLHAGAFASWARGHLLCRVEGVTDRFALTFDDGPSPVTTPRILDRLARRGARATFFTLARHVRRAPALIARMEREGHEVAAHGDRHWPPPLLLPGALRGEVRRSVAAIVAAGGGAPRFYRPPFGFMLPGQAWFVRGLGLEPVLGDVYPEDPRRPGIERIVERVIARLCAGSILILHDGSPLGDPDRGQTVAALDPILDHAASAGLAAVTLGELVERGVPPLVPARAGRADRGRRSLRRSTADRAALGPTPPCQRAPPEGGARRGTSCSGGCQPEGHLCWGRLSSGHVARRSSVG